MAWRCRLVIAVCRLALPAWTAGRGGADLRRGAACI